MKHLEAQEKVPGWHQDNHGRTFAGVIICTSKPKVGVLCNTLNFFTFLLLSTMELKVNLKGFLFDFWLKLKNQKFGFSLFFTGKMGPQGPPTWPPTESCAHLSGHLKGVIICTSKPKVGVLCNTFNFFNFLLLSTMELKVNLK